MFTMSNRSNNQQPVQDEDPMVVDNETENVQPQPNVQNNNAILLRLDAIRDANREAAKRQGRVQQGQLVPRQLF